MHRKDCHITKTKQEVSFTFKYLMYINENKLASLLRLSVVVHHAGGKQRIDLRVPKANRIG